MATETYEPRHSYWWDQARAELSLLLDLANIHPSAKARLSGLVDELHHYAEIGFRVCDNGSPVPGVFDYAAGQRRDVASVAPASNETAWGEGCRSEPVLHGMGCQKRIGDALATGAELVQCTCSVGNGKWLKFGTHR